MEKLIKYLNKKGRLSKPRKSEQQFPYTAGEHKSPKVSQLKEGHVQKHN